MGFSILQEKIVPQNKKRSQAKSLKTIRRQFITRIPFHNLLSPSVNSFTFALFLAISFLSIKAFFQPAEVNPQC